VKRERDEYSITIIGSCGGVAKAILAIFNHAVVDNNDPLYSIMNKAKLHLIDIKQKKAEYYSQLFPNLKNIIHLHQMDVNNIQQFKRHLMETNTKIVVDVSWGDTIETLRCCNQLGVLYVNSALENTMVDEDESLYGFPLTERYLRFESVKEEFTNTKAIVCSGMNPGVVQWMAITLMKENPKDLPIACYIVEHDTSFFEDNHLIKPNTLYTSWSVECFLDEAILSYPMFVKHHLPLYLYEDVYSLEYKVRLGDKEFYGCLMPHEEVITLGKLFDMEVGFIYRINEHTTALIRNNLDHVDDLWDWNQIIIDPAYGEVEGEDLVGVLFVYSDHEKYMYNVMKTSETFAQYKTNATYFQVACGIYAGLASLLLDTIPLGVYYVDELLLNTNSKYGDYLTYYMKEFVIGCNKDSDGLLHQRMKKIGL
jgi:homospermidine synthase